MNQEQQDHTEPAPEPPVDFLGFKPGNLPLELCEAYYDDLEVQYRATHVALRHAAALLRDFVDRDEFMALPLDKRLAPVVSLASAIVTGAAIGRALTETVDYVDDCLRSGDSSPLSLLGEGYVKKLQAEGHLF
jgi:hypothetical protein